jgi:hypothetical protein
MMKGYPPTCKTMTIDTNLVHILSIVLVVTSTIVVKVDEHVVRGSETKKIH